MPEGLQLSVVAKPLGEPGVFEMGLLTNNVKDCALIFEGGGMRNSYSAAVANVLLENGIFFDAVYGLSAGASNAINYVSRDARRAVAVFTEHTDDIPFRRPLSFAMQGGIMGPFFVGKYVPLARRTPFDFATFEANPAQVTLEGVERRSGETAYWTREDFKSEEELRLRVQATTSFPIILPPTYVRGVDGAPGGHFYDGSFGEGGGIMLPRARRDGFEKYFVVCTQPRGYRKPARRNRAYDVFFWRWPKMRALCGSWAARYNEQLDALGRLEQEGRACVFYSGDQVVINSELNRRLLKENYARGYQQAQHEVEGWLKFLGL